MANKDNIHNYQDIINMTYPFPSHHIAMSMEKRAAQFAPFAALTGHQDAIDEKERRVDQKRVLSNSQKQLLDQQLQIILFHLDDYPFIEITYFEKDDKKEGGRYLKTCQRIKKYNEYNAYIELDNHQKIDLKDIYELEMKKDD